MSLLSGLIVSSVFYLINDYIPQRRYRLSRYLYIETKMRKIQSILTTDINRPFLFDLNQELITVQKFVEKFVFQNKSIDADLEVYTNHCNEIHSICEELMKTFGRYLTGTEQIKIEYLLNNFNIEPFGTQDLIDTHGIVSHNENLLKLRAYSIYKAYEVIKSGRFKIPFYLEEEAIMNEIFQDQV